MEITTRTTPRQARSARSVDLILDAAEQVFHRLGISEASTVDIAAAAGVSVGRLYYWFPDKDAVIDAMIVRSQVKATDLLTPVAPGGPAEEPDVIERITAQMGAFFLEHPGTLGVLNRSELAHPGSAAAELRQGFSSLVRALVVSQVPDVPEAEAALVAETIVRIGVAYYVDYLRAEPANRDLILQDLRYVLSSYFNARYPTPNDHRWSDPDYPIRPARPRSGTAAMSMVEPAMIPSA